MDRLRTDHSTEALVNALVTYQMGTEGILAETGYFAYFSVLKDRGIMPGMQQIIQLIQRDESRHVGYGIYLLSRLIAEEGDAVWGQIEARLSEVLMGAVAVVGEMLAPYGDDVPFGLSVETYIEYAQGQFQKRYARLEKARSQPLAEILYGKNAVVGGDGM